MKIALGVKSLDDIGRELMNMIQPSEIPTTFMDKLKALPKLAMPSSFLPKTVKTGPLQGGHY